MPVPVFAAGHVPTAAELEQWSDQIDSLTAPGWTSYTPTWAGSTTNPTIGNSTLNFRYRRPAGADLVIVAFAVFIGSTFSAGSGNYTWTLPVTASSNWSIFIGAAYIFDSGAAARYGATIKLDSTGVFSMGLGTAVVAHNSPQVWAVNDELKGTFMFEPA